MVYTTYKNGDDWGMVNITALYPRYGEPIKTTEDNRWNYGMLVYIYLGKI